MKIFVRRNSTHGFYEFIKIVMHFIQISTHYQQLPDNYKQEANDFIEFFFSKSTQQKTVKKPFKRNAFGSLKGKIHMADDFDSPLEDFKEYM